MITYIDSKTGLVTGREDNRNLPEAKNQKLDLIKILTSQAIEQTAGLDEKTQQNAALGIYSPERCEAIKNYIAACRNEYLRCKALILSATTNDEADAIQFNSPSIPEGL